MSVFQKFSACTKRMTPRAIIFFAVFWSWVIANSFCKVLFYTAQKMKFSIKDFFSKCDQIHSFLRIWSHLLKKSLMENFIFCAVLYLIVLPTAIAPSKEFLFWFDSCSNMTTFLTLSTGFRNMALTEGKALTRGRCLLHCA